MIRYNTMIHVVVDGESVGFIHDDAGGFYYLPHGYTKDRTTKIYPTLSLVKAALESE